MDWGGGLPPTLCPQRYGCVAASAAVAARLTSPWLGGTWPSRYSMDATQEAESAQAEMMLVWLIWVSDREQKSDGQQ